MCTADELIGIPKVTHKHFYWREHLIGLLNLPMGKVVLHLMHLLMI
jgi:hypothetical protein